MPACTRPAIASPCLAHQPAMPACLPLPPQYGTWTRLRLANAQDCANTLWALAVLAGDRADAVPRGAWRARWVHTGAAARREGCLGRQGAACAHMQCVLAASHPRTPAFPAVSSRSPTASSSSSAPSTPPTRSGRRRGFAGSRHKNGPTACFLKPMAHLLQPPSLPLLLGRQQMQLHQQQQQHGLQQQAAAATAAAATAARCWRRRCGGAAPWRMRERGEGRVQGLALPGVGVAAPAAPVQWSCCCPSHCWPAVRAGPMHTWLARACLAVAAAAGMAVAAAAGERPATAPVMMMAGRLALGLWSWHAPCWPWGGCGW